MKVIADGYAFEFQDALAAFVFDEKDPAKDMFHGAPMKAVDMIVELENSYLFIEIKHYDRPEEFAVSDNDNTETQQQKNDHQKWLKNYLKYKFRDTFLYRYAEGKTDKPVHYLCLVNFDNALNTWLKKNLRNELPVGKPVKRWQQKLAESCQVLNLASWNTNFPKWQVKPAS